MEAQPIDLDQRNSPSMNSHPLQRHFNPPSPSNTARPHTHTTSLLRASSSDERHTLPEIPRNALNATVAHVVSRELGENFLKAPIRPGVVKKLVVSSDVDDLSHRLYVQHLREIQAKREYQLQKIEHDEEAFLLADILAHENADADEAHHLSSFYIDEQTLSRDQVILPRDFLHANLQRQIKSTAKDETASESPKHPQANGNRKLPKLTHSMTKKKTLDTVWKEQMSVPERDLARGRLQMIDSLTHYQINPRFDEARHNQLITSVSATRPPALLPVFEAVPSEITFTRYRVGDVHETTLALRNLSSVAHSCRVLPPKTPHFCISLPQYPSGQSLVATGLSVVYNIKFVPDTLGSFEDEIVVQCSNGTEFTVKLLGKRPPPLLTLPTVVDCGYWLVGGRKLCEFKVRNDGGEGRFAIVPGASWPAINFKAVVRNEIVHLPPFEVAPSTLNLRSGDTFPMQVSFTPQSAGEFVDEFIMICDNDEIARYKLRGVAQNIEVQFEDVEGGVIDINELDSRDISAQYSIHFIPLNPFSYCQKRMKIKNLTNVELPFVWAILEPVLYTREDFANQTQPVEIERLVSETSTFHVEPSQGTFPPSATVEFRLLFAPAQIGNFHTVFHLIVPNAPVCPSPSSSPVHHVANNRIDSPQGRSRSPHEQNPVMPPTTMSTADYTVLRFETRGVCESFKYLFDPFAIIFMDKLHQNLAYRKDFQLTNTSISSLMITWTSIVDAEIIHVEPVMAEIPADATCQFTLILTGTKIGQAKIELPFKIDGIDGCGYLHVEAEITGSEVEVDPSTIDLGLVEYGAMVERMIEIKNLSPTIARCRVDEVHQDTSRSLMSLPNGHEIILKPIEVYQMPVRILAEEEGAFLAQLQVTVEDGKTIPIEITAVIQRPSAYLSPVELNFGDVFLHVPTVRAVELHAINALPTEFRWEDPICADRSQCHVDIQPRTGILLHGKPCSIEVTITAQQCGRLSDDWYLPCYIHKGSQPIFLKLSAAMQGMMVEFRHGDSLSQWDDPFVLDFDRVPLGEKSALEVAITNLTDIESTATASIAKLKTRISSAGNGQKTSNFEPIDQDIGVGFHLPQPNYPLLPRGTTVIPLSVISSMWGTYSDVLRIQIEGIDSIKEIPVHVQITGHPIKTYLSVNPSDKSSSLSAVQFGSVLHNSLPIVKKVHMQNISHVPLRIDWIVYDIVDESVERPLLVELIPVIDHNPFDKIDSKPRANTDRALSRTTTTTQSSDRAVSSLSTNKLPISTDTKPAPLIQLYVKPYRGKRTTPTDGIYSVSMSHKIIKPREHFYADITMSPRRCPIQDRPLKCHARAVGVLSVSEERQGSSEHGFHRPVYYDHEENIEFEMHASLEMPSLRVELDDEDCDANEPDALSFAIPVGDILSDQPNMQNRTSSTRHSTAAPRHEKVYTRSLYLLNTRQCTIPFELSISDASFLSIAPSTLTTLTPQSKAHVQCHFHLTQDLIDRFQPNNLETNPSSLSHVEQSTKVDLGHRMHWREKLAIRFKQNEMEQTIPIDIRLYYPILLASCDTVDFGTCFVEQTRQREFVLKNLTCSSSAWSIRKVHANMPEAYEAFRIEPESGLLATKLKSKERCAQQVVSIFFTARHSHTYECQLIVDGVLGERPISIFLTGQGSYDGKYEAILDI